jgi:shikimate dehydrogenase
MDRYAVFGNPIAQSKSPAIHSEFSRQSGQKLVYEKQLVDVDQFKKAADDFFLQGGLGLNITVPFKLDAFAYATQLTPRAKTAGAVNTLKKCEDGSILGDNTDGQGLVDDIMINHHRVLKDKRVLILGAGGAVRGVLQPLLLQQPREIVIANRTLNKAEALMEEFKSFGCVKASEFLTLDDQPFDVVINGTSASLSGRLPPLSSSILTPESFCFDMMYSSEPTVFLKWAKLQGCDNLADGLGMLVGQAAESFFVWRGVKPETQKLIKSIREQLQLT